MPVLKVEGRILTAAVANHVLFAFATLHLLHMLAQTGEVTQLFVAVRACWEAVLGIAYGLLIGGSTGMLRVCLGHVQKHGRAINIQNATLRTGYPRKKPKVPLVPFP